MYIDAREVRPRKGRHGAVSQWAEVGALQQGSTGRKRGKSTAEPCVMCANSKRLGQWGYHEFFDGKFSRVNELLRASCSLHGARMRLTSMLCVPNFEKGYSNLHMSTRVPGYSAGVLVSSLQYKSERSQACNR
eukprot:1178749-Rhodomonas_salina.1